MGVQVVSRLALRAAVVPGPAASKRHGFHVHLGLADLKKMGGSVRPGQLSGPWPRHRDGAPARALPRGFWLERVAPAAAILAGLVLVASGARARDVPPLAGRVTDAAGLLPLERRNALEAALASHEARTHQQFVVLTIDTLGGDALEDFSLRAVETYRPGSKKLDNGLLLLVVRDDHKVRIEVGYGLEGVVTDALSARVIDQIMVPAFRAGRYADGIEAAITALTDAAARGNDAPVDEAEAPEAAYTLADWYGLVAFGVMGLMFAGMLLVSLRGLALDLLNWRSGSRVNGGPNTSESSRSGSSSTDRDSFSGGGGSFGGGGASGQW